MNNPWCESCARKNRCYCIPTRPKCYMPITNSTNCRRCKYFTTEKCHEDDIFDPEKGLAMAITKKALGNKGNYCNELKKWLPEKEEPTIAVTIKPYDSDEMRKRIQSTIKNIENACKQKKE